jgi:hypothetical protein
VKCGQNGRITLKNVAIFARMTHFIFKNETPVFNYVNSKRPESHPEENVLIRIVFSCWK